MVHRPPGKPIAAHLVTHHNPKRRVSAPRGSTLWCWEAHTWAVTMETPSDNHTVCRRVLPGSAPWLSETAVSCSSIGSVENVPDPLPIPAGAPAAANDPRLRVTVPGDGVHTSAIESMAFTKCLAEGGMGWWRRDSSFRTSGSRARAIRRMACCIMGSGAGLRRLTRIQPGRVFPPILCFSYPRLRDGRAGAGWGGCRSTSLVTFQILLYVCREGVHGPIAPG